MTAGTGSQRDVRSRGFRIGLVLAATVGAVATAWAGISRSYPSDLAQLLVGARALVAGRDPYHAVIAAGLPYPLFYPLPAVLLVLPIAWLPDAAARVVWVAAGSALLGLAAMRYGRGLAVALISASLFHAALLNQWSPLLTAAAVFPNLTVVWAAKPSIGAALFAAYPSRRALWLVGGVTALSFVLMPSWPMAWLASVRHQPYTPLIMLPGGALLLLALLRWRLPEARLLAALACVPHSWAAYETVPLFLIPRRRIEAYGLALLQYGVAFGQAALHAGARTRWFATLGLVYLPALALVLWPRREAISPLPERRSS